MKPDARHSGIWPVLHTSSLESHFYCQDDLQPEKYISRCNYCVEEDWRDSLQQPTPASSAASEGKTQLDKAVQLKCSYIGRSNIYTTKHFHQWKEKRKGGAREGGEGGGRVGQRQLRLKSSFRIHVKC